ncbi:hypothetical protein MO867_13300 [Microbulbifer sp. OS29]|uniref:DUF5666 domain-containing protein n=1 Tax=Microbulbifer okhotskensis TaxID=2926617 RepID=A0A9X2J5K8_9GAMM|nr:hypothetical protein [Microbulbifer okhotskensis]MCO1335308.1 hypothetical protein [Microbulbifer okhotskensis]
MKKAFILVFGLSISLFSQAEETVTGTLEEIISEDFETGKVERSFSLKDEHTGKYYFIDADEVKKKGMESGDRVKIRGEEKDKRRLHIKESEKIETRDPK